MGNGGIAPFIVYRSQGYNASQLSVWVVMDNDITIWGCFVDSYSIPFVVGFLIHFDICFSGTVMGVLFSPFDFTFRGDDLVANTAS